MIHMHEHYGMADGLNRVDISILKFPEHMTDKKAWKRISSSQMRP
jgi:hypothetical protein